MSDCGCEIEITNRQQARVLVLLLFINALMFVLEISFGIISQSTALIADSMDMLADAAVYGVALYAVGRSVLAKSNAAHLSGILQVVLGVSVLIDVIRRILVGSEPVHFYMMTIGFVALIANVICLLLISRHRDGEVHMRASWIFSKNDVIANLGVIISGGLVYALQSNIPDLVVGMIISVIIVRGGIQIINDALGEKNAALN